MKDLGLPVIIQGEDRIDGTINWNELLEAADKANTHFIDEKVLQTDLCALPFSSGHHQIPVFIKLNYNLIYIFG